VVAPREDSLEEARFFSRRLEESSMSVSALVVNRLFPDFATPTSSGPSGASSPTTTGQATPDSEAYEELLRNLAEFQVVAMREARYSAALAEEVAPAPVVRVPFLSEDVHDLEGLRVVARHLLSGQLVSGGGSCTDRQ